MIEVSRTTLTLFGMNIRWYGILIVLGIAAGVALAWRREKRIGLPPDTTLDLALVCIPAAILGARIYFVAFSWEDYAAHPIDILKIWEGGLAIYGGVLAGLLAGAVYARKTRKSFLQLADLAAPSIALGQAIGRWGNFMNQEAHGAPVQNVALNTFPVAVQIGNTWYYATFFYESVWCMLIVAVLLLAERKQLLHRRGDGFFAYVLLYGLERAVVEGLRTDSLYLGPFRVSQMLSLIAVLSVAIYWAVRTKEASSTMRILPPLCALAMLFASAWGSTGWMFALAGVTLVFTQKMYFSQKTE